MVFGGRLRLIKAIGVYLSGHKNINSADYAELKVFYDSLYHAKPFILSEDIKDIEYGLRSKLYYLPFKVCTFEYFFPKKLIDQNESSDWFSKQLNFKNPYSLGTIFVENDDLSIDKMIIAFDADKFKIDERFNNLNYIPNELKAHTYRFANYDDFNKDLTNLPVLYYLYDNAKCWGETLRPLKIKKKGLMPEMVKKIIVISGRSASRSTLTVDGMPIDWRHQWRVRGHWRKIEPKMLGKNREGDYVVVGNTWVKDFVKGSGPLIEKTRILKGENTCPA